jgi:uncharacterized protein
VSPKRVLLLAYEYVPDVVERRPPHREAHLAHIAEWHEGGELAMAGAVGDPPTRGMFVFELDDPARVEEFAVADPYVNAGLVTARRIEPLTIVADRPLRDT